MLHRALGLAWLWSLLPALAMAADFERTVPAQPGGTLRLELDGGQVEVEPHDEPQVRVEAHSSGWGSLEFEVESDGSQVVVRGRRVGLFGGVGGNVRVSARVPRRFNLDIRTSHGSIEIDEIHGAVATYTSGGSIGLAGVRGSAELRTSGGSIRADEIEGDLQARTSGGTIRVSDARGRVEARTSGGSIEVLDIRGPVHAETSGGSVSARFTAPPQGVLKTSGGSIEIEIPEGASFDLDARTSGGRVEIDEEFLVRGRVASDRVEAAINGGGPKLEVRTSGGDVHIDVE